MITDKNGNELGLNDRVMVSGKSATVVRLSGDGREVEVEMDEGGYVNLPATEARIDAERITGE